MCGTDHRKLPTEAIVLWTVLLKDSAVKRGNLFKEMLRKKFYCYCHVEGQFLSNCHMDCIGALCVRNSIHSLGLKREHNGSQCWEDQGVGQVQAHRNPHVSPSPSLLLLPCLLRTLNLQQTVTINIWISLLISISKKNSDRPSLSYLNRSTSTIWLWSQKGQCCWEGKAPTLWLPLQAFSTCPYRCSLSSHCPTLPSALLESTGTLVPSTPYFSYSLQSRLSNKDGMHTFGACDRNVWSLLRWKGRVRAHWSTLCMQLSYLSEYVLIQPILSKRCHFIYFSLY